VDAELLEVNDLALGSQHVIDYPLVPGRGIVTLVIVRAPSCVSGGNGASGVQIVLGINLPGDGGCTHQVKNVFVGDSACTAVSGAAEGSLGAAGGEPQVVEQRSADV